MKLRRLSAFIVARPKYVRTDLSYVEKSFFVCGSVDFLRIYIYIYAYIRKM